MRRMNVFSTDGEWRENGSSANGSSWTGRFERVSGDETEQDLVIGADDDMTRTDDEVMVLSLLW